MRWDDVGEVVACSAMPVTTSIHARCKCMSLILSIDTILGVLGTKSAVTMRCWCECCRNALLLMFQLRVEHQMISIQQVVG